MTAIDITPPHIDPEDSDDLLESNPTDNPRFADVLASRISRRRVLAGGAATAALTFLGGVGTAAAKPANGTSAPGQVGRSRPGLLGFPAITPSTEDTIRVPEGYAWDVLVPWGDPIQPGGPAFREDASNTAAEQALQLGMGHDGMHFFPIGKGNDRGLLVVNHEYTTENLLHPIEAYPAGSSRPTPTAEVVAKSIAAHGVAVVEVARDADGVWQVVASRHARRITADTPMTLSGPAAGSALLATDEDPTGTRVFGTFNNCSHGYTPWGTYLTCEENFNGYFRYTGSDPALRRYGVGGDRYGWAAQVSRFDADREPNMPNKYGWVVEIDPFDATSTPIKRTALGRFKHEGAEFTVGRGKRAVVYMGDDERGDYFYKFVSAGNWSSMRARGVSPLDEGVLYVARFDEDGTGRWLPLVHGEGPLTADNGFADQAEVLIRARMAADALGATRMDRPEWAAVHPKDGSVFFTLTNNTRRGTRPDQPVDAANPRARNAWGHIIRIDEAGADNASAAPFAWDIFLLAGPTAEGGTVPDDQTFGSPDGLWFDGDGRLWIQTDGTQPGGANDQMLAADPATAEVRRFLTGVRGCEVTGVVSTPDQRTFFVNIQHPGDAGTPEQPSSESTFPFGGRPRPCTVVITRRDGGVVGT